MKHNKTIKKKKDFKFIELYFLYFSEVTGLGFDSVQLGQVDSTWGWVGDQVVPESDFLNLDWN